MKLRPTIVNSLFVTIHLLPQKSTLCLFGFVGFSVVRRTDVLSFLLKNRQNPKIRKRLLASLDGCFFFQNSSVFPFLGTR
jgi:hypothetical protein